MNTGASSWLFVWTWHIPVSWTLFKRSYRLYTCSWPIAWSFAWECAVITKNMHFHILLNSFLVVTPVALGFANCSVLKLDGCVNRCQTRKVLQEKAHLLLEIFVLISFCFQNVFLSLFKFHYFLTVPLIYHLWGFP